MAVQMPAMKKLVLIGDSIRMGYEATVRTELAGLADIWTPAENGQHTVNLLLRFTEWVVQQKPDVLHINAGLWDTRNVIRGQPGTIVPLEIYRLNVRRLLAYCKANAAKVIWATMTPIDQAKNLATHAATGIPARQAPDIALYNQAAVEECHAAGVPVNDLHAFIKDGRENLRSDDGVHYTGDGYAQLGRRVASVLREYL